MEDFKKKDLQLHFATITLACEDNRLEEKVQRCRPRVKVGRIKYFYLFFLRHTARGGKNSVCACNYQVVRGRQMMNNNC